MSCVAFGCSNRTGRKSNFQLEKESISKITFHRFPRDPVRRRQWIKAVCRRNWTPTSSSLLCSQHFSEDCFDKTSLCVVRLRDHAVPSIFPGFPAHLQKIVSSSAADTDAWLDPQVIKDEFRFEESGCVTSEFAPGDTISENTSSMTYLVCQVCNMVLASCKCFKLLEASDKHEDEVTSVMRRQRLREGSSTSRKCNHKCDRCGKSFAAEGDLTKHMETHKKERSLRCELCGKTFINKSDFLLHVGTHTVEDPFNCNVCGKSFERRKTLVEHNEMHRGEHLFQCELCSKSFNQKIQLVVHIRTHTGSIT
ncbi:zinc finger protein 33B-like isoform X1 [Bacillus rossius redtenbacheri]|uniref:zinc finger protein 33B-like isoform X1 n=1 Tax=Bacillus rossius redtenbacheri TaxID=93214 RepID=UPI002FDD5614